MKLQDCRHGYSPPEGVINAVPPDWVSGPQTPILITVLFRVVCIVGILSISRNFTIVVPLHIACCTTTHHTSFISSIFRTCIVSSGSRCGMGRDGSQFTGSAVLAVHIAGSIIDAVSAYTGGGSLTSSISRLRCWPCRFGCLYRFRYRYP